MFNFFNNRKRQQIVDLQSVQVEGEDDWILAETKEQMQQRLKNGTLVDQYESIASIYKEPVEELLAQSFTGYFEYFRNSEISLPAKIIDEIIERIKLNLTEQDLLFGVNELLQQNHIQIANQERFENFVIGCKIFYQVRKQFFVATSAVNFNDLEFQTRKELAKFHGILRKEIFGENIQGLNDIFHFPKPDPILAKLKINYQTHAVQAIRILEASTYQLTLETYGLANCGAQSDAGIVEFLKLQSQKILTEYELTADDHTFLMLYSDSVQDFETSCYIDTWAGRVYPGIQISEVIKGHVSHSDICMNETYDIDIQKAPRQFENFARTTFSFNHEMVCDKAIASLESLQQAAEMIVADINKIKRENSKDQAVLDFLLKKQEDLLNFSENIRWTIEEIDFGEFVKTNVILVNELNDLIENFYTVLYCKILRAPYGSKFFEGEFLQELKNILWDYARYADSIIDLKIGVEPPAPQTTDDTQDDEPNDIENNSFDGSEESENSSELQFQMNL